MNYGKLPLFALCLLVVGAPTAQAAVSVHIGIGGWPVYGGYYSNWEHREHRSCREATPVVVAPADYYGGYPYPVYVPVQAPPAAPALSGDHGADFANLNAKLSRLRGMVQRQQQTGSLSQDQYDRFMNTLDGIEHDEHARAYDRGGNLETEDFADLDRRLDQAGQDIEIALAQ